MVIAGLVLSVFGAGFFCWLLFTTAIYALPAFAGFGAMFSALNSGLGLFNAAFVGLIVAGGLWAAGRIGFAGAGSPLWKLGIALLYATPATVAGYSATIGLCHIGISSEFWRQVVACAGGIFIGASAFARLSYVADHRRVGSPRLANGALPEVPELVLIDQELIRESTAASF